MCETLLSTVGITRKIMCKFNQVSEWQSRPLRKSQLHYAALDAVILLTLFNSLMSAAEAEDEIMYTDNKQI